MTAPSPEGRERLKDTLFVTDAELYRRLGLPLSVAKPVVQEAEAKYGFPRKAKLWGDRRYWPAVREWLDRTNGLKSDVSQPSQRGRPWTRGDRR
jgi:hypothetical protein